MATKYIEGVGDTNTTAASVVSQLAGDDARHSPFIYDLVNGVVKFYDRVNSAVRQLVTIDGTETLTGKTLTSPTIAAPLITGVLQENVVAGAAGGTSQVFSSHAVADATFVDFFTVTVPNQIAGAGLSITVASMLSDGDSAEMVTFNAAIARIAGAATAITFSAGVGAATKNGATGNAVIAIQASALTGANGAQQTFTVQIKNTRSAGAATADPTTAIATLTNLTATGISIVAA